MREWKRLLVGLTLAAAGCTTPGNTLTIHSENDLYSPISSSDRHYTNGARASWVFPTKQTPKLAETVVRETPVFNEFTEAVGVVVGQNLYTPEDIGARRLLRADRPHAAWLYTGLLVANIERNDDPTSDRLDSYELDIGVVGDSALGEETQKTVHKIVNSPTPHGWDHQLHDELALLFRYDQRRRLLAGEVFEGLDWDVLGGAGAMLGNVYVQGTVGVEARIGSNVPRDFGVSTIDRTSIEVGLGERSDELSWYAYGGAEARAVAHNMFLDGNTFRDSHSVDKEPVVGEFRLGVALAHSNWRITYAVIVRTREFKGQDKAQHYGSLSLQYVYDF